MTNRHSPAQKIGLSDCPTRASCLFGKPTQNGSHERGPKGLWPALRESSGFKESRGRVHDVENPWTTLCVLPAARITVSSTEISQKIPYVPSSFGRKRKKNIYSSSPSVKDEFAYKMKECPPCTKHRIYISTRKRVSHFFSRCICIFLDLRAQRTVARPCVHQNF